MGALAPPPSGRSRRQMGVAHPPWQSSSTPSLWGSDNTVPGTGANVSHWGSDTAPDSQADWH